MTVNPGWGGQPFIPQSLDKLRRLRALVGEKALIEVDGGVGAENIRDCAEAGASVFVAGSAVFGAEDAADAVRRLTAAISGG
jgi:ribulose-phosphate 3-epimerase